MRTVIAALLAGAMLLSCSEDERQEMAASAAQNQSCAWNEKYAFCICFYTYPGGLKVESSTWVPNRVCKKPE